jgi:hypothetical protein
MRWGCLRRGWLALCGATCLVAVAHADPWLAPGDEGLRADILLLSDAGVLNGPVITWPMSWPDIARDVLAVTTTSGFDAATLSALLRVQRLARAASAHGFGGAGIRARAAHEPTLLRDFADTPREEGELGLRASWLTDHLALNLQASIVADADDGHTYRADGSYLGINVGNFMISAGLMERWWSPGWDSSLILSSNARPIPSLTVERNYTEPFKTKLLSWAGPWRASIAIGEAERHGVAVSGVRFLAARVDFKPRPWMEVALTRTAQWCGGDRPCGWSVFSDLLIGRDNQVVDGQADDTQPGNQMAGYDLRLRSPWRALPLAFYTQWIGEDEAGGLPSRFIGLYGLETWGSTRWGGLRLRAEYADTTCNFTRQAGLFDCAYRNGIYPQGYTYRGRVIGDSMDNDSRRYVLGGVLTLDGGTVISLALRRLELNRNGGAHAVTSVPTDLDNVELRLAREFAFGKVSVGLGYDDPAVAADDGSRVRGFINWQQGF